MTFHDPLHCNDFTFSTKCFTAYLNEYEYAHVTHDISARPGTTVATTVTFWSLLREAIATATQMHIDESLSPLHSTYRPR